MQATTSKIRWATVALLVATVFTGLLYNYPSVDAISDSFSGHRHSVAYDGPSKSWMDRDDSHIRVCDQNHNLLDAKGVVSFRYGSNIVVTDTNGTKRGCGDKNFAGNGYAHRTFEGLTGGAWSRHPG